VTEAILVGCSSFRVRGGQALNVYWPCAVPG
jgi:hypothetical protein